MDALLRTLLGTARRLLSEHGEFYPIAAARAGDASVEVLGAGLEEERPRASDVLEHLETELRRRVREEGLTQCGLCSAVELLRGEGRPPENAVRLHLERADGPALEVYVPYRSTADGVEFDEPEPRRVAGRIFAQSSSSPPM